MKSILAIDDTVIGGKYRIGRELGRGGMGYVHEAEHLALGGRVALKFLKPELARSRDVVERFLREARSLFRIDSENVVRVLDVDANGEAGRPYLVMELLEGAALDSVLEARKRLTWQEATEVVAQICDGLGDAHRLGIVHRDVKPQNVMVTAARDGAACMKLLDFGIAQVGVTEDAAESRLTVAEAVIGTPSYMAPEHLRSARAADARSDVWSAGVLFYELLTGELPWIASSPGDLVFRQYSHAVPLRGLETKLPPELIDILFRCLALDPADRFEDALALAEALEPWRAPVAVDALLPASMVRVATSPARRTPAAHTRRGSRGSHGSHGSHGSRGSSRVPGSDGAGSSETSTDGALAQGSARSSSSSSSVAIVSAVGIAGALLVMLLLAVALHAPRRSTSPSAVGLVSTPATSDASIPSAPAALIASNVPIASAAPTAPARVPEAARPPLVARPRATSSSVGAPAPPVSPSIYTDKW